MKIHFELKQAILHKLGYKEEKIKNVFNYKKSCGNKRRGKVQDFPRFHIRIEDGLADIHIDEKRRHGFIQKWMGFINKKNIKNDSYRIKQEVNIIKHAHLEEQLRDVEMAMRKIKEALITKN